MALALPLLLALLGSTPGLGAPGGGCGMPPSAWCQDWVTALRCGALEHCPHLTQGHLDVDICAVCQQTFDFLHQASNQSTEVPAGRGTGATGCHCGGHGHSCAAESPGPSRSLRRPAPTCRYGDTGTAGLRGQRRRGHCHGLDTAGLQCPPHGLQCPQRGVPSAVSPAPSAVSPAPSAVSPARCPQRGVPSPQDAGGSPEALAMPMPMPLCWLCRTLVARAEAAVPVGSVAAAVAGLCRALPLPVAAPCQCLAERYAALVLQRLLDRLSPRLLCRLFLACRGGDTWDSEDVGTLPPPWALEAIVVRLAECVSEEDPKGAGVPALSLPLGPCALGPIFWCSGPKAAQRCQALQYCQEHVWL
ncbi:pulmonary surfactant-associated protein B [Sylvia atricapilla]|uniref:pulmonary surfactant-associated protein B n=1 Tax=Sylvia atricapilla TaxID=48155 RepID=UPI003398391E